MTFSFLKTSASFAIISTLVLLPSSAFSKDRGIAYPNYVETEAQKIEFTAKCVAVFQKAEKNAIDDNNEIYAQKKEALWANHLEKLEPSKKKRKKLVKKQRKLMSNNKGSGFLAGMADMKAQTQCQFPSEDLRGVG